jgi:hypothetical protein
VRPVEDHDLPFGWRAPVGAPEEVVGGFDLIRLFEANDRRPLRVHRAEHVAYHAVLAAGVERLQDDQQWPVAVGVQQILQLGQAFDVLLDLWRRPVLRFVLAFECWVNLAEPDSGSGIDDESLAIVHRLGFSYGLDVDARAIGGTCGRSDRFTRIFSKHDPQGFSIVVSDISVFTCAHDRKHEVGTKASGNPDQGLYATPN